MMMRMNKAFLALAAVASELYSVDAQEQQALTNKVCTSMQPICTASSSHTFLAESGSELLESEQGNDYDCHKSQYNPTWFYLKIDDSGKIVMSLTAAKDIDYIIWGPFDSLAEAVSLCDGGLVKEKQVGCSYSSCKEETITIDNAISGKIYVLLITNHANKVQTITLSKTGGPGTTNCDIVDNVTTSPSDAPSEKSSSSPSELSSASPSHSPSSAASSGPSESPSEKPSASPSESSSASPSHSPSSAPSSGPSESPSEEPSSSPSEVGETKTCFAHPDPHYMNWNGEFFNFQKGCDTILVASPEIEIHLRLAKMYLDAPNELWPFSGIESVAIRFTNPSSTPGGDIFEITDTGKYYLNDPGRTTLNPTIVSIAGYAFSQNTVVSIPEYVFSQPVNEFKIALLPAGHYIKLVPWNHGLWITIRGHSTMFSKAVGMCGNWNKSGHLDRDGDITVLDRDGDTVIANQLGQNWQVGMVASDPLILSDVAIVSPALAASNDHEAYPTACAARRRLTPKEQLRDGEDCDFCKTMVYPQQAKNCKYDASVLGCDWVESDEALFYNFAYNEEFTDFYHRDVMACDNCVQSEEEAPSEKPSASPNESPSARPSQPPLAAPTTSPSESSTASPSKAPSEKPLASPNESPSARLSQPPSAAPPSSPSDKTKSKKSKGKGSTKSTKSKKSKQNKSRTSQISADEPTKGKESTKSK